MWEQEQSEIQKVVVNLPCNTGGAGGFPGNGESIVGIRFDWIWVSDDDAYPEPDALKSNGSIFMIRIRPTKRELLRLWNNYGL